jgi:hypothetical protein
MATLAARSPTEAADITAKMSSKEGDAIVTR